LLRVDGDRDGAKRVLTSAVSSADFFERLIENEMVLVRAQCRQLTELGVLSEGESNQRLASCGNLTESALATPLHLFRNFLAYAQTKLPTVWQALADALAKEENRQALAQSALATPLSHLASFLEYAQTKLPTVWHALARELELASNMSVISQIALVTNTVQLTGFLVYATGALPNIAKSLNAALATDFRGQGIQHPRLKSVISVPLRMYEAEAVFGGCGCRDLVEEVARMLIHEADPAKWTVKGIGLAAVSTVLRLGRGADDSKVQRFLETIVTPKWLETNYSKLPPGKIAIALHALWAWTPDFVRKHFHSEALIHRARGLVYNLFRSGSPDRASEPIKLLGACRHFGLDVAHTTRRWPPQAQLTEILRFFESGLGQQHLSSHQILFLIGLREMARHCADSVAAPGDIGERVLALWRATVSPNPNHQMLNAWMIEWLERCAKANWRLLRDNTPVPEPVRPPASCGTVVGSSVDES
jgi:hypothetical protein